MFYNLGFLHIWWRAVSISRGLVVSPQESHLIGDASPIRHVCLLLTREKGKNLSALV